MADLVRINASETTDVHPFTEGKGELRAVELHGRAVGVATFEPGWRWSQHVKPIVGGDSCQNAHTGVVRAIRIGACVRRTSWAVGGAASATATANWSLPE